MFRKTLKQLKYLLILVIVLVCFPRSILPHQTSVVEEDDLENYVKLNENELRLIEYKDSEEALKLKLIQLEIINNSRKKFKADPVKLDILASRVANKMCREAAENNFVGHWNTAGEKPYHRYAFAGGYDHVSENAFGEWSSDNYDTTASNISSMMKAGHGTFMAEKAPNDGHKKTIIDKSHNFVGIGFYLSGKQFRYYEEFIDRYLEFENIPVEVKVDEPCSLTVKTNGENYLYFLIIYREKYPQAMMPAQIRKKGSYEDYTNEVYNKMFAWDMVSYRNGSTYKIPLSFSKEGIYYLHFYSDKKEIPKPATLNTKGKTPVSGIVIKVNK
ncbi:MAG: CAP domain-containing protein [Bacteroidia bacterium]|nr:CAP domain-containing protein [Bacteroidia bacterium]